MSYAVLFFNSLHIPYHVMDYALEWAKDHEAGLHAIFVSTSEEPSEEYGYPSDIDSITDYSSSQDAKRGMDNILYNQVRLMEKKASATHVPLETTIHRGTLTQQLLQAMNSGSVVFADAEEQDPDNDFSSIIDLQDIRDRIAVPVRHVSRKEVYLDDPTVSFN